MIRPVHAVVIAMTIAVSFPARAQVDPTKMAAAEALYRDGRKAFEEGKYDTACPKLEKSLKLDRAIGTMWHLARCYEEAGQKASAWALFLEVAAEARRLRRGSQERAAAKRAAALENDLCRLRLVVPEGNTDLEVWLDDKVIPRAAWNQAFPVDCGARQIRSRKGDAEAKTTAELVEAGATVDAEVPIPAPEELPEPTPPEPPEEIERPAWYGDWLGWTLVAGGVGAGAFALYMNGQANTAEESAGQPGIDLAVRDDRFDDADSKRIVALSAAGVGAALLVTGVIKLVVHDGGGAAVTPTEDGAMAMMWMRF